MLVFYICEQRLTFCQGVSASTSRQGIEDYRDDNEKEC